jgi:hypothetical protein
MTQKQIENAIKKYGQSEAELKVSGLFSDENVAEIMAYKKEEPILSNAKPNANNAYEQWKISRDKNTGEVHKVKLLKTVKIPASTADLLNAQTQNSNIAYYLKS